MGVGCKQLWAAHRTGLHNAELHGNFFCFQVTASHCVFQAVWPQEAVVGILGRHRLTRHKPHRVSRRLNSAGRRDYDQWWHHLVSCFTVGCLFVTVTISMVKTFQAYLPSKCHRTYSCVHCRAHLANHDELISKVASPIR